ncbi:hypothetical protein N0V92_011774 [Colletotrichum tropicale]|nr:hypothetical protein N0V92_011774 [Colletotrichum tropicale]
MPVARSPSSTKSSPTTLLPSPLRMTSSSPRPSRLENFALTTDFEVPSTGLSKRAMNSKFKIHVVNAAARVLGIIIIDYTINLLPGSYESITANFDKLTSIRTNGPIVATHFEGDANLLAAA